MDTFQNVKFQALDQVWLRGKLYAASQRGPAVILTPGVSSTVSLSIPAINTWAVQCCARKLPTWRA